MVGRRMHSALGGSTGRRRTVVRGDGSEGKFMFATLLQSMLCVMMITAAFIMSSFMGMTDVKTAFFTLISKETEAVEVFSVVQKVTESDKISRLRSIIELILSQVGTSPRINVTTTAGQGGQLLFLPKAESNDLPDGVTNITPLLSAPMRLPVQGILSSTFGVRKHPITRKLDFHTGVDFAAPLNTPIGAAWPGVVVETGESQIYGRFVTLDHGGYQTRYCHCNIIAVKVGMRLRQGETLAYVGNSGVSTGPHLHFELIINGRAANPLAECTRWQAL
ncbi:M23 family metallopeptidase [Oscillospiraceae bacterium LTW-04]|nr:M23 family metallopeptidase [Oscillospiraceae bacterium MB24-C1]